MGRSKFRNAGLLLFAAFAALNPALSRAEYSTTLVTTTTVLIVHSRCEEGVVNCGDVWLTGVARRNGEVMRVKGADMHSATPNGSPGAFQGYSFVDGNAVYLIDAQNVFSVVIGEKLVLQEAAVVVQ